jgi:hypothetical protein
VQWNAVRVSMAQPLQQALNELEKVPPPSTEGGAADTSDTQSPSSIAARGFALSFL